MSYLPTLDLGTHLKASILTAGTPNVAAVGGRFTLSGTVNGSFSIVSNRLRLVSGSSYYLEGSLLVQNASTNGAITWQWYNNTSSSYVGAEGFMNFAGGSFGGVARVARRVASALVLDSDISTSADYELRIKSMTGTNWNLTVTATGMGGYSVIGYPSTRVLELPT